MKIVIENTNQIVQLVTPDGTVPARLWFGKTEKGIDVQVLVTRIAVNDTDDNSQFQRELQQTAAPKAQDLWMAFPLRMVL